MQIKYAAKHYVQFFKHTALGVDLLTWCKVLAKNGFAIDIRFWPKAFFISVLALLNAPFQVLEYLLYHKRIKKVKVKAPVFIIGHPRSGTTYLHYVLSKDPAFSYCRTHDALIPHLTLTFGKITSKILDAFMPKTRPQDNVRAGADMPKEEEFALANLGTVSMVHGYYFPRQLMANFEESVLFEGKAEHKEKWKKNLKYFAQKLSYKYPEKRLLLKSPFNTGRIKEILEVFPDASFIHIHRNPYEVFQSNVHLYEKIIPVLGLQKPKNEEVLNFVFSSYNKMYRKFLNEKQLVTPPRFYEISYNSFIENPEEELELLYQHLSLGHYAEAIPYLRSEIKQFDSYKPNDYSTMKPEDKKRVENEWGFMMNTYEY